MRNQKLSPVQVALEPDPEVCWEFSRQKGRLRPDGSARRNIGCRIKEAPDAPDAGTSF